LYNIDTSHFDYQYSRTHNGKRVLKNRSDDEIFNDTTPIKQASVKKEYISRILHDKPYCEECKISN
jgi:hypothetical protein